MESIHVASRILKSFDIYLYSSSLLSFFFFFTNSHLLHLNLDPPGTRRFSQNFIEISTGYRGEKFFLPYQRNIRKFFHTSATCHPSNLCTEDATSSSVSPHEVGLFFRGRASPRLALRTNRARVLVPVRPPRNTACHLPTLA